MKRIIYNKHFGWLLTKDELKTLREATQGYKQSHCSAYSNSCMKESLKILEVSYGKELMSPEEKEIEKIMGLYNNFNEINCMIKILLEEINKIKGKNDTN